MEYMLYILWDLGLKVGHAVRSVDDCIRQSKADVTIRTAILESRYLWGPRKLFHRAAPPLRPRGGGRHRGRNSSRPSWPSATTAT
ncbi:hypothetical protein [Azospirillum brasilense]|uniref:hypothetical protein n=1 Tax=Azospirillum brasilense TaxID=192 RepID=UPI000A64A53F